MPVPAHFTIVEEMHPTRFDPPVAVWVRFGDVSDLVEIFESRTEAENWVLNAGADYAKRNGLEIIRS
jgi:hypothetical protein